MKTFPYSAPIEKACDYYVNWQETTQAISPEAAEFRPRRSNTENFICDKNEHIIYSARTITVFTGPKHGDWKQVITHIYDREEQLVYHTEIKPYLEAASEVYKQYKKKRNQCRK
jgi:hypothetical protein